MSMLPLFIEMQGKRVLIIGGGRVALRKARVFSDAGAILTIIAPDIADEFASMQSARLIRRKAMPEDVDGDYSFVLIAGSDKSCNQAIAERCRALKILVSRCDDFCSGDFVCSAPLEKETISIGLYCSGLPEMAKFLKKRFESDLTGSFATLARIMAELRPQIKEKLADENLRREFLARFINEEALKKIENDGEEKFRAEVLSCL